MFKDTIFNTLSIDEYISVFDMTYVCTCQCHKFNDPYFRFMSCMCCKMASIKYINDDNSIN